MSKENFPCNDRQMIVNDLLCDICLHHQLAQVKFYWKALLKFPLSVRCLSQNKMYCPETKELAIRSPCAKLSSETENWIWFLQSMNTLFVKSEANVNCNATTGDKFSLLGVDCRHSMWHPKRHCILYLRYFVTPYWYRTRYE